jgi:nitrate reductase molybdenum cofactor assembly chaperone NarJ/NarW
VTPPASTNAATPRVALADRQRAVVYQAASVLLGYPDDGLLEVLPVLRRAVEGLPTGVGEPLRRVCDHLGAGSPTALAADYVATFDLKRRCCPYLTYYVYGDTRRRGMALLAFKHAYRGGGLELADEELPDHLAVLLEFAAAGDPPGAHLAAADALLREHRTGLELLRLALADDGSAYHDAVDAVCRTLPALPARDRETVLALAREGPPAEDVGLDPYSEAFAPPEYMGGPRAGGQHTGGAAR